MSDRLIVISTTSNTTKFFLSLSNLCSNLIWSFWVASRRKIKIWIWGKKVYYWKGRFAGVSALKTQLSVINWTFFPRVQILIFLRETSQNDHNRLLYKFENDQKNLVVLGVVDMRQLELSTLHPFDEWIILIFQWIELWLEDKTSGAGSRYEIKPDIKRYKRFERKFQPIDDIRGNFTITIRRWFSVTRVDYSGA